jgi:hypothetical protein
MESWTDYLGRCGSRLSALARGCFLRGQEWRDKARETAVELRRTREQLAAFEARCQQAELRAGQLEEKVAELQQRPVQPRPVELPLGEVPPGQQYGANVAALAVNLGRELGLRRAERAMKIFFNG